jgi:hypothetical protein
MFREAKELLPHLPEADGEATHAIMSGRYDLMVLLATILELYGSGCQSLRITTLSFNDRNALEMAELLRSGRVGAPTLLCSSFFRAHNEAEYAPARREAALFPGGGSCMTRDGPVAARATGQGLELGSGSRIVSLPGTEGTIRGYSAVSLLIGDEAARVSDALYYAVRPMLAVSQGRLLALSTPFGKRGWFCEEWTGANRLGKLSDPSALALLQWTLPAPAPWSRAPVPRAPAPKRPEYNVPTLKPWPLGMPYREILAGVIRFLKTPPLSDVPHTMVFDATGLGDAVFEMAIQQFTAAGLRGGMRGVQITAGNAVTLAGPRRWHVAKKQLGSVLQVLLGNDRLHVAP